MRIETMSVQQTVETLRELGVKTSAETLRRGIEQGVYPFGVCISGGTQPVYQIFRRLFDEWAASLAADGCDGFEGGGGAWRRK